MANLVQVEASNMLSASIAAATYTATTSPVKLRLMSANNSSTAAGTEISGGGYTAGGSSLTAVLGSVSAGSVTNTSTLSYTNMPAVTTVGVEVWDSAGTPIRKWWGALTSNKATAAGDTLSFAASSITLTLA